MSHHDQASLSDDTQRRFDDGVDAGTVAQATVEGAMRELAWLRAAVRQEAQAQADDVPAAAFERMWQQTLPQLAARPQPSPRPVRTETSTSWWDRWQAWWTPARMGWSLASAGVAAVLLVLTRPTNEEGPATALPAQPSAQVAANSHPGDPDPRAKGEQGASPVVPNAAGGQPSSAPIVAQADLAGDPVPVSERAESTVERIEFGGRSGRISQIDSARGVTTVIWLSDTEDQVQPKVQDL